MRGLVLLLVASACGRLGFETAPADAPAVEPCAHLFCDSFEDPALPLWDGATIDVGSTIARDAMFGRSGASLHALGDIGDSVAAQFVDVFPAAPPTDERVRVYIFTAAASDLNVEPLSISNPGRNNQIVFSLYTDSVDIHAHGMAGGFNVTRQTPPPRDRWVCYELHVVIGAAGEVELFEDGVLAAVKAGIDTRPPAGDLSRVLLGITSKDPATLEDLWFDDVAADTAPIGCN